MRKMMKRMQNGIRKQDGYFTVEATLMFSAVLFIILAILFSFMLLFQSIVLTNAATSAAQQAAYTIGASLGSVDPAEVIREKLNMGLFSRYPVDVTLEVSSILFQPVITVTLRQRIPIPGAGLIELFNQDAMTLEVSSSARATDRPEFARNINLIIEIVKRIVNVIGDVTHEFIKLG